MIIRGTADAERKVWTLRIITGDPTLLPKTRGISGDSHSLPDELDFIRMRTYSVDNLLLGKSHYFQV